MTGVPRIVIKGDTTSVVIGILLLLVGIPPLAGFVGKFYVFSSAVRAGYIWLPVSAQ